MASRHPRALLYSFFALCLACNIMFVFYLERSIVVEHVPCEKSDNSTVSLQSHRTIQPIPTAIVTCLQSPLRDCSSLAKFWNKSAPKLVASVTFIIHDMDDNLDHFIVRSTDGDRTEVVTDRMGELSLLMLESNTLSMAKCKQFYHFLSVIEMTLNNSRTCSDETNVVVFLDDDIIPCPDAASWLLIVTQWLQTYPPISAVRAGGGSSGLAMTCSTLRHVLRNLTATPMANITAIDTMIDRALLGAGHYLYFHHYLFRHLDDHPSLIQHRDPYQTSPLLHFCRTPILWFVDGRPPAREQCAGRLFDPCEGLAGLPEIPEVGPLQGYGSECDRFEAAGTEWAVELGQLGEDCDAVCRRRPGGFVCDAAGVAAANTAAAFRQLSSCAPVTLHFSDAVPAVFDGACLLRATGCQPGSLDGFCAASEMSLARLCPCARPLHPGRFPRPDVADARRLLQDRVGRLG